jgi:hypothetical protein
MLGGAVLAEVTIETSPSTLVLRNEDPKRLIDQFDPRLVNGLTAVGFGLPIVGYFWVILHFGVNVIYQDQLSDISVISAAQRHVVPWRALWTQYQDNRLFFPNALVLLQAHTIHFDIHVEELVSALFLLASTVLIIWAHKRRARSTPWLYYCPVALLTFSLVQYQGSLFGYQLAWYLILLALAASLVLIDARILTWVVFGGAVIAAVVGSLSSFQGLLIWPTGLFLLYHRRRHWKYFALWIASAAATCVLYFRNLNFAQGFSGHGYVDHHIWASLQFFVFAIGDVAGFVVRPGHGDGSVLDFGVLILVLAVLTALAYGIRRDEHGASPIGIALVIYGLVFAASTTEGRASLGFWGASQSRYTTFDLLILVGIYLALLEPPILSRQASSTPASSDEICREQRPAVVLGDTREVLSVPLRVARIVCGVVLFAQILLGAGNSIQAVRGVHEGQVEAVATSLHIDTSSDATVRNNLEPYRTASYIRTQIRQAKALHLSLFSNQ